MHAGAFQPVNLIQSLLAALFLAFPDQPKRQGQSLSIRFDGEKDSLGVGQAGLVDGLGGKEEKKRTVCFRCWTGAARGWQPRWNICIMG